MVDPGRGGTLELVLGLPLSLRGSVGFGDGARRWAAWCWIGATMGDGGRCIRGEGARWMLFGNAGDTGDGKVGVVGLAKWMGNLGDAV